jgi:hypothetical protein
LKPGHEGYFMNTIIDEFRKNKNYLQLVDAKETDQGIGNKK